MNEDDDFGLSSSDEAELLNLLPAKGTTLKRKNEDESSPEVKRLRTEDAAPASSPAAKSAANLVLRDRFGFKAFQLKQEAAITRLLDGESAVVVFPTGQYSLNSIILVQANATQVAASPCAIKSLLCASRFST
jgi:hypothetical protein